MILDVHRVFVDDTSPYMLGCGEAFSKYGINPERGAIVVVRPDLCEILSSFFDYSYTDSTIDVSRVLTLTTAHELIPFFKGCLNSTG
jgi:phenol 2-monooxygenase